MHLSKYAKAIVAAFVAAAASLGTAAQDGIITSQEWIVIVAAGIAALGVTWAVPNKTPQDGDHR
jgi:hypothetical protein